MKEGKKFSPQLESQKQIQSPPPTWTQNKTVQGEEENTNGDSKK